MDSQRQTIQLTQRESMLNLYDRYAAMLLGYIFEIVKDRELAEQYMVSVFKAIAGQYELYSGENTWIRLQQLAKSKLTDFFKTVNECETHNLTVYNDGKGHLISMMSDEQRNVFCAVYYQGKTTAEIARQFNQPELLIRKALKEAFAVIRKSREHTGLY